ncbi:MULTISPECIES: lipocalin-like domain-containing protein [unclassified Vibrio]|uniref:Lipocalin-like domain-containing protein n=1 Tax=Vibrio sp. HB236076 TaxID=3232307 RepID=A0AB39HC53_9VIBR|nr:lipocalin-like domain-containing protein [Vibrio sp. HB161653]MDP5253601.1 lipocalin-like domain-containing protein [Vibrio sp. HB161653]
MSKNALLSVPLKWLVIGLVICWLVIIVGYFTHLRQEQRHNPQLPELSVRAPDRPGNAPEGLTLPNDLAFHQSSANEIWQMYAVLNDKQGHSYRFQWQFLQVNLATPAHTGWQNEQRYYAQATMVSLQKSWMASRIARGGFGQAGTSSRPMKLWIDDWQLNTYRDSNAAKLKVRGSDFAVNLDIEQQTPGWLKFGQNGLWRIKSRPDAWFYNLSAPRNQISGVITLDGVPVPVSGRAWVDHVWGSQLYHLADQDWQWLRLRLDDDRYLSVWRYHNDQQLPTTTASLVDADGNVDYLTPNEVSLDPVASDEITEHTHKSLKWKLSIPKYSIYLTTQPVQLGDKVAEQSTMWQGQVYAYGTQGGSGFFQILSK